MKSKIKIRGHRHICLSILKKFRFSLVKIFLVLFWRPYTLVPGDILCTTSPPSYASSYVFCWGSRFSLTRCIAFDKPFSNLKSWYKKKNTQRTWNPFHTKLFTIVFNLDFCSYLKPETAQARCSFWWIERKILSVQC